MLTACAGDDTSVERAEETDSSTEPSSESDETLLCEEELPEPGEPFRFEIVNRRTERVFLPAGCGVGPIRVRMPDGDFHLTPPPSVCGFDCTRLYEDGEENAGCSDCGNATDAMIEAEESWTFEWDRRYFVEHVAPEECAPPPRYPDSPEPGRECGFGVSADADVNEAVFSICLETEVTEPWGELCVFGAWEEVTFLLDLSSDGVTIEIE
jgi:hypothetical protein